MGEVFGLTISEGAIANILARAQTPLLAAAAPMAAAVRTSAVVGSDETPAFARGRLSARVCAKPWWQWVLLSSTAIRHVIADARPDPGGAARMATAQAGNPGPSG